MTRGEIWWVDFGVPFGSEVGFRRPVIILQNDVLNESKLRTVVVLPLTTNLTMRNFQIMFSFLKKPQVCQKILLHNLT